ncbi:MAG: SPOR domain-containing protein [Nitrospirota bacterium]|nr:SPOR domain-containing protein [Nitrospirota bacterium]
MADETILVIDADPEIDQKINSTLEAEGYLVFSSASHVVTDEIAEKCKPALIYIKPLSPSAAGFQPCRTIHIIPKLQNVPIVLLASLKGMLEPQHTEYYGIVDFLKLNFTSEELIAKTVSVLASAQPSAEPEEEAFLPVEEVATFEETPAAEEPYTFEESPAAEEPYILTEPPADKETPQKTSPDTQLTEERDFPEEDEMLKPSPSGQPLPRRAYRQGRVQRPSLLPWLIGLLIVVLLGGGGFFAYERFMPAQKPATSEPRNAALPIAPEQKEAVNAPSVPPVPAAPAPVAPAQAPEPQPSSVSQPVPVLKKPLYAVQVGAYKTEEIANNLVKKLQGKGYEAFAQKGVTKDNSPIIRVLIGNFSDRKAAMKLAGEIQTKEQIKTTIFTN